MIEQTAKVVSIKQGYAWVLPAVSKDCASCQAMQPASAQTAKSCATAGLFNFFRPNTEKLYAANPVHAKPGDEVVIGMQANTLLMYSAFAYLLPLLSMILFALLGKEVFIALSLHADAGAILAGVCGLWGGLHLSAWQAARIARSDNSQPVILRLKEQAIMPLQISSP